MKNNQSTMAIAAGMLAASIGVYAMASHASVNPSDTAIVHREVRGKNGDTQRVDERGCEQWSIYFESGSYALLPETRNELSNMARCFESDSVREIAVIGSADSSGESLDNLALAEARANTVRSALSELGFGSSRVRVYVIGDQLARRQDDPQSRSVVIVPRQ